MLDLKIGTIVYFVCGLVIGENIVLLFLFDYFGWFELSTIVVGLSCVLACFGLLVLPNQIIRIMVSILIFHHLLYLEKSSILLYFLIFLLLFSSCACEYVDLGGVVLVLFCFG